MGLMQYLQSEPTIFLVFVIIVSLCILFMAIHIFIKLEREKRVMKTALELNKITNSIRAGLVHFVLEDHCRILYASKGFYEMLGYSKHEVREEHKNSVLDFISSEEQNFAYGLQEQLGNGSLSIEVRMITKSGQLLHALMNGNSSLGKDGKHTISAVIVDISEQKKMQEMLILEGERYKVASELSKDVLFEYLIDTDEMIYSEKYKELFGRNSIITLFHKCCELRKDSIHSDDWGIYLEFCKELVEGKRIIEAEFRMKDRMNNFIWCQVMGKTIYDDDKRPIRVIGKIVDIDTQKRELEALEYKATRDPLTGVYNKEVTIKKIDKYINGNKNDKHILMFIDFDDFKKVNDNYGHLLGDKILIYVIGRIKSVFSEGEIIGRIGGDEFIVFSGGVASMEETLHKAETLVKALDTVYLENGLAIPISGSIGVASYPEDGLHCEQLIQCADKAMYRVMEQGKNNYLLYSSAI